MLSKHKFCRSDVLCTSAPPPFVTGRVGAIRLKRKGLFDFIVFSVYMPVERGETECWHCCRNSEMVWRGPPGSVVEIAIYTRH